VAIGITISDRLNAEQLGTAASLWTYVTLLLAMFFGGWISTRFTVGEFRNEAILYGLIVWGVTSCVLIPLSLVGIGLIFSYTRSAWIGAAAGTSAQIRL